MADRVGQQLGNYRLLRVLGQGSFAEVYLAEHQYLERLAAIKVLHVQIDAKTQEQFRREARTIAHLQHPHIVQVLEFGLADQTPYLVMEYTPGGSLRSQHPTGTCLPLEQIVTYVNQIASALDYAHQQRVIHRDVKPDNLLLNANHEVLLSDFGIAVVQLTLDSLEVSHPEAGTPLYIAPEQIQRQPCAASDQYALGIMVYEWLAGEAPFRGTLFEVFSHHLHQPPPSLYERLPGLPVAVEEAVFKALAKDPMQRFASVTDFALAFEEACDATQTLALPWLPKQSIQEPVVSYSTQLVPPVTVREQESSTQPASMTMQQTEHGEEAVLVMTPGPSQPRLTVSTPVKLSLAQSNRHRFLRRVRAFWIDGVLEHSLHGAALIALGLQEQLDALANPWHLVLHHPDSAPRSFPLGTRISEVYDAANGQLLILGAPGSGKTTLVLELARDLLARAEQDAQQQMPVIFTLSSWAAKQQPLAEWMREELINKYQVPRQLAHVWVETDQILPLLDGLDEVETLNRTKCIEAINTYHQEHAFLPLVVSSRSADYLQQTGRVRLTSAITIQPLTQQQVDDYLAGGGEALWALRVALHQDTSLRELAETPLMLSILTLTYHDMPVEDLLRGGIAPTRQQVFECYVERMLSRRGTAPSYPVQHTRGWLAWLARQMKRQSQTVFYLERLQPDWLHDARMLRAYHRWAILLPGVFIGVLVTLAITLWIGIPGDFNFMVNAFLGGLLGGLLSGGGAAQRRETHGRKRRHLFRQLQQLVISLLMGLGIGLSSGLIYGVIGGLIYGMIGGYGSLLLQVFLVKSTTVQLPSQTSPPIGRTKWQRLFRSTVLRNGLVTGLIVGLSNALSYGLSNALSTRPSIGLGYGLSDALIVGLSAGVSTGLSYGFIGGLLSLLLLGRSVTIQLTERVIWSWKSLGRSVWSSQNRRAALQVAALVGLSTGLSAVLIFGLAYVSAVLINGGLSNYGLSHGLRAVLSEGLSTVLINGLINALSVGLIVGLSYWFLSGLFQGVSGETIEDQQRVVPNQGIHRSALNGLVLGLVSTIIVGLSAGLSHGLSHGLSYGLSTIIVELSYGLSIELSTGLSTGLSIGLLVGLSIGLLMGGWACLRHYVLRLLLWRAGAIPWNYPRFLDYAAEHILLRKVGGGYIFVHRLLLEYFASLDSTSIPDITRPK